MLSKFIKNHDQSMGHTYNLSSPDTEAGKSGLKVESLYYLESLGHSKPEPHEISSQKKITIMTNKDIS